ncbi:unnamed protein product [Closterium sp. NIES-53]
MASQCFVFASQPPSPSPPCIPCIEGRLRATPLSSSFRSATAPFQTLDLDVRGLAPWLGPKRERFFLVLVDDYSRYITVFPLAKKYDVTFTQCRWLLSTEATRGSRVICLHSYRGGVFCSGMLAGFCGEQGITQSPGSSPSPLPRPHASSCSRSSGTPAPPPSPAPSVDSGGVGAGGVGTGGARSRGVGTEGAGAEGAGTGVTSSGGAGAGVTSPGGHGSGGAGAGGAGTRGAKS